MFNIFQAALLLLAGLSLAMAQLPTFNNTPGLTMQSPFNGMTVTQNSVTLVQGLIPGNQLLTFTITTAKTDGSSNITLGTSKTPTTGRVFMLWNVTSANYPVGDYILEVIAVQTGVAPVPTGSASTSAPAPPAATIVPGAPLSTYTWRALLHVANAPPASKSSPNTASALTQLGAGSMYAGGIAILYKMAVAMVALALGCVLTL
ncbi:hypothetical protein BGZ99_005497 [Dissophora globulifera]|uniref:Uncharacterized protein n=1 Tax=Dissophora globulifera TaxID=979702 RepID=A0A9P6REM7_9FUNG|nr:hypothetical protein BGZ99_005497 [Dissophora globulifera]